MAGGKTGAVAHTLERLILYLEGDASHLEKTVDGTEAYLNQVQRRMTAAGAKLSVAVSAPLAGVAAFGIKEYAAFDDAMTKSVAIMTDVSETQRKEMESVARTLSNQGVTSATELAKSYFYLASAGYGAADSMQLLGTVEKFAVAGAFDMARATDLLTDAQTALGLQTKDLAENQREMTRLADVLIHANTLANASAEQFAVSLTTKSAAAARQLGIEVEELVSILAVYANQGIKAELAGERTSIMLRDLQTAVINNKQAWDDLRLSVYDENGEMRKIADIVQDLTREMGSMSDEQQKMALMQLGFTDRSLAATTALFGQSDAMRAYEMQLQETGFLQEVYEAQLKSFSSQMAITRNQIVNAAAEIGSYLAPALLTINGALRSGAEFWDGLSVGVKGTVVALGTVAGAVGPTLLALSLTYSTVKYTRDSLKGMSGAIRDLLRWYASWKTGATSALGVVTTSQKQAAISAAYYQQELATNAAAARAEAAAAVSANRAKQAAYANTTTALLGTSAVFTTTTTTMTTTSTVAASTVVANFTRIGTAALAMGAAVQAGAGMAQAAVLNLAGSSSYSMGAAASSMKLLPGPTMAAANSADILDASFTRVNATAAKGVGIKARLGSMLSGLGTRFAGVKSFASAFKVEIAALAGYLSYKLTMALTGASQAYEDFTNGLQKSKDLSTQQAEGLQKRQQAILENAQAITDLAEREAYLQTQLQQATKEWQGYTSWIDSAKFAMKEKRKELNAVVGEGLGMGPVAGAVVGGWLEGVNKEQQLNQTQLDEAREQAQNALANVNEIRDALDAIDQERTTQETQRREQLNKSVTDYVAQLQLELETMGMSARAAEVYKLKQQELLPAQQEELDKVLALVEAKEREIEAREEEERVRQNQIEANQMYLDALQEEADTYGMSAREIELYRQAKEGLTDVQQQEAQALIDTLDAKEQEAELRERANQIIEDSLSAQDKFLAKEKELRDLLGKGLLTNEQFSKALALAEDELDKMLDKEKQVDVQVNYTGIDALSTTDLIRTLRTDLSRGPLLASTHRPQTAEERLTTVENQQFLRSQGLASNGSIEVEGVGTMTSVLRGIERNTAGGGIVIEERNLNA